MAEKLEELSVNDDKTKSSEDKKEEVKEEKKEEKTGEEEKKWARNVASYGSSTCHFPLFYNRLWNWKIGHFCFFLFGRLTSQDLGATLNASISQSSRCCELLSHSQTLISPFIFSYIVDQSSVIMYLCIYTTCYDTRLVLLIDSHIG